MWVTWLNGVVYRLLDLRLSVMGSIPSRDTARLFLRQLTVFRGKLSWDITTTRSTQPCIPPGAVNRAAGLAGVQAGKSPLPGGR